LREVARNALIGVGDASLGEWHEWTGFTYHIRRRLKPEEQLLIGPAIDIRGTDEAMNRWRAICLICPWLQEKYNDSQLTG